MLAELDEVLQLTLSGRLAELLFYFFNFFQVAVFVKVRYTLENLSEDGFESLWVILDFVQEVFLVNNVAFVYINESFQADVSCIGPGFLDVRNLLV
jgi:hypothetical protein